MSEADFDRALGAWEDNQLNAHFAQEEAWDQAYEKAEETVWGMTLTELSEVMHIPVACDRKIEEIVEIMAAHVAQLLLDEGKGW